MRFDVPSNWKHVTLEQVAAPVPHAIVDGPFGSSLKLSDYVSEGVPVLQGKNITNDSFRWFDVRYISESKSKQLSRSRVRVGDVLIVKIGSIGYSAVVRDLNGFDHAVIPANLAKVTPDSAKIDTEYLHKWLTSIEVKRYLLSVASKTAQPALSLGKLKKLPIPLPPLSEQKRIAEILDRAEALRAKRRAALALLDELTQSIFLDMFGDPIHNEKGWHGATLAEIAQFENGDRSSNYPSGDDIKTEGVLFLSTKNIVDRQLELRDAVFITHEKFKSLSRGKLKPMDLIITLRGTLGSCCLFDSDYDTGFINAQMMIIRPRESALPRFLHAMLTTKQAKDQFKRIGHGGAVPQLTATQLSKLVFALPPVDLQKCFCERLQSAEKLIAKHESSLRELDQLFASLQHRAFRGELS